MNRYLLLLFTPLLHLSCVEVTDLRPPPPDIPSGQVDTSWSTDSSDTVGSKPIPCTNDAECTQQHTEPQCLNVYCEAGFCQTEPVVNGSPCTDQNAQTRGDQCINGACAAGPDVCVCSKESDCALFDDGNPCNGRLSCDGCACTPIETPPGSPCDDQNPATVEDQCVNTTLCQGALPCTCADAADCGTLACTVATCVDCQCTIYAAIAGLLYAEEHFEFGLPTGWQTTTTNELVAWRPGPTTGLQANGLDGTYDHGAVTATLQSPELVLPTGNAVLQLTVGLYAAVSTCNDRLEIWLDNTLVDTLCGPVEPTTFSYGLVGGDTHQLRLVFISDATENSGAGPLLKHLQWVRSEPDLCGPDDTEQVVPEPTTGLQRAPVITLADTGWKAFWHDEAGVWRRTLDEGAKPSAPQALLESNAQHVSAAGPWVAWERPETHQIIVQGPNNTRTIGTEQTLFAPAISAKGALAYLESQGEYTSLYQLNDPFTADQAAELIHTTSSVSAPRVTIHNENTRLVVRVGQSILLSNAISDELETVATQSAFERPDLASGHQRLVIVWAQANHLMAQSEGEAIEISSVSPPRSPVVVATQSGWFVAWTAQGPDDTGVAAALLPPDASTALGLASVSAYTFANQDSIALAPDGGGALAIWRSDWLDGDASGVVLRRLQASPLP